MILVLATDDGGLCPASLRLGELGLTATEVIAPSDSRRLLLASVADEPEAMQIVGRLRAEGYPVVLRPAGGVRLTGWVDHTRPKSIAARLSVCLVWSEHDRRDLPNVIELDPAWGFGAGGHPTTRLLLEALATRLTGGERVLDVGCGSGVLALGALRLGASSAVAIDVDPRAVTATRRNAELNGFGRRLSATCTALVDLEGSFDVVLANIGRMALIELGDGLVERLASNGWLAVSGIPPAHRQIVAAALHPLDVIDSPVREDWAALVLRRQPVTPS